MSGEALVANLRLTLVISSDTLGARAKRAPVKFEPQNNDTANRGTRRIEKA
jgi:hypothetical protein